MKLDAISRLQCDARRVSEIIVVLARYGLADWLKGLNYAWIQERLRSADGQAISGLKTEVGGCFAPSAGLGILIRPTTNPKFAMEGAETPSDINCRRVESSTKPTTLS